MVWLFQILLAPTFALTLLLSVSIAVIRAHPYDDIAMRAFLVPSLECPMPCFLGIRPGATTVEEAHSILAHCRTIQAIVA
jgi:hypothetical protein